MAVQPGISRIKVQERVEKGVKVMLENDVWNLEIITSITCRILIQKGVEYRGVGL